MRNWKIYRVSTLHGGSLDNIVVDVQYDTIEERRHRAWCKLLENERSPECKMAKKIIAVLGVDRTKRQFGEALVFEEV